MTMSGAATPLPTARYEATIHADRLRPLAGVDEEQVAISDLDLDRVPDPDGGVRVLIDGDDIPRLVGRGFEVRLLRAIPVRPLEASLVATDEDVDAWFANRISGTVEG
jgi:hypothetical protein